MGVGIDDHPNLCEIPIVKKLIFFRACAMTVVRAPDRGVLLLAFLAVVSAFIVSSYPVSNLRF